MRKVRSIIYAIAALIFGVVLLTMNVNTSQESVDLSEISARDLANKTLYYAEDLTIMDAFAATDDEDVLYMAVMFEDEKDDYVVVTMPVNKDDGIWADVHDYLDDNSLQMGDYVVSCYVMTEKNVDVDNQLFDLFDEWVDNLESDAGISVVADTELRFNYLCDGDGDPYAEMEKSNTVFTILGIICLALAAVLLYFGVLRKPRVHITPTANTRNKTSKVAEQLYLKAKPYKFMGKTPDLEKAFNLHLKAANMGYAPAQYEVGFAYALGFGVAKDEQKAFQWYLCAAQQGDATSQRNVAHRYSSGEGVHPDPQLARYWYQRAVDGNDGYAMLSLGKMYEDGIGGDQNLDKALELYHRAAEKGIKDAKAAYEQLAAQLK